MTTTMLDIPAIIQDIIRKKIKKPAVDVVENIYDGALKAPMIVVKGEAHNVESLGKGLYQYNTPVIVACWHSKDSDADDLRDSVATVFQDTTNAINPVDKDSTTYGIKHIEITNFDQEDVLTTKGDRYGRTIELDVLWYLEYT